MTKKILMVAIAMIAVLGLIGFAVFEVVQAQAPEPNGTPQPGYGPFGRGERGFGMRGMRGGMGGGMGAGMGMNGEGWMHEEMIAAFAEKFDMTPADLEARLEKGDKLWQVAEEKGMTTEEFFTLHQQVRSDLIDQAVKDGKITQEQADWMKTRMGNRADRMGECYPRMFGGDAQANPAP